MATPHFAHRGHIAVDRLYPDATLIERVGGRKVIERIVDGLYDRIEIDNALRPMFRGNLDEERAKQYDFWQEWFGGAPTYTHHHAYNGLRLRHAGMHITRGSAHQWLTYLTESLNDTINDPKMVQEILDTVRPIAHSFVNEPSPPANPKHLRCHRERPYRELKKLADKGHTDELLVIIKTQPALLQDTVSMADVLQAAAFKGRTETVKALLKSGVDPNQAAQFKEGCIIQSLMLTPLCVALLKDHTETAECLQEAGATYDIFTACYLGDIDTVDQMTQNHSEIVNAEDPANDTLQTTPLFHAVYGGHLSVVELLFQRGAKVGKNSTAMVKHAANNHEAALTQTLLNHGADATRVGPGPWVRHKKIAKRLIKAGADVNYPKGEWIWRTCTGNNSQRDNPDQVQALIDLGADLQTRLRGATALHYTAKAGFLGATDVLTKNGADPNAISDQNETPIFYALKAGKRADVPAMCSLLVSAGADPHHKNKKGATPIEIATRLKRADKDQILSALKNI